jgi:hypothetical protein
LEPLLTSEALNAMATANGFKSRTFHTGIGALKLSVPQVRESDSVFLSIAGEGLTQ